MPPHPAAALLSKRWDLLAEYKDQHGRERTQLGLREALRVVDSLRTQAQFFNPSWPTPEDREADLETHLRVSAALARTAPGQATPHTRPPQHAMDHAEREVVASTKHAGDRARISSGFRTV